jgi:chromosome segregation ATPase
MGTRRSPSAPQWQVILEEMRSENRATLEAVLAFRSSLEARIERLDVESRDRDAAASLAVADLRREVRQHSSDLTELKRLALRHGGDIDGLKGDVTQLRGDVTELKQVAQHHGTDIRELKVSVQENTLELRGLSQKVDALNRLEERVAALERRAAEAEGSSTPPPA